MIHVSHLSKWYGSRSAIHDLNFEVKKGEIVGFLGPNGAGKSTTMKVITGFMPATEGKVTVGGFDVFENDRDVKRNIGFLPENPPVYPEMSVEDYLGFAAQLHQVKRQLVPRAINTVLEKTGLTDVRNRLIGNLSKGYRQRVGLAQALVHNPQVLILDEPTVGLDPKQIIEIRELIKSLGGDHTLLLSSHILPEVTATCQRIIVINRGTIVAQDTLEQLTTRINKGVLFGLWVKKANPEDLEALGRLEGVRGVSLAHQAGNAYSGTKVVIEIQSGTKDIRSQIIELAVQQKMGVLEFAAERVSLEEIFLQLTTVES